MKVLSKEENELNVLLKDLQTSSADKKDLESIPFVVIKSSMGVHIALFGYYYSYILYVHELEIVHLTLQLSNNFTVSFANFITLFTLISFQHK